MQNETSLIIWISFVAFMLGLLLVAWAYLTRDLTPSVLKNPLSGLGYGSD